MSAIKDGCFVSPIPGTVDGMSLRDYFAAKAMEGWLASFRPDAQHPSETGHDKAIAEDSYFLADAMLAAREGGGQ